MNTEELCERFTDRARDVMRRANAFAVSANSRALETSHVLVGLLQEPAGVAGHVLRSLGVNEALVREEVLRLTEARHATENMETSSGIKSLLMRALSEARELDHNHVGTEHLLLALAVTDGLGSTVLKKVGGVSNWQVRTAVLEALGKCESPPAPLPDCLRSAPSVTSRLLPKGEVVSPGLLQDLTGPGESLVAVTLDDDGRRELLRFAGATVTQDGQLYCDIGRTVAIVKSQDGSRWAHWVPESRTPEQRRDELRDRVDARLRACDGHRRAWLFQTGTGGHFLVVHTAEPRFSLAEELRGWNHGQLATAECAVASIDAARRTAVEAGALTPELIGCWDLWGRRVFDSDRVKIGDMVGESSGARPGDFLPGDRVELCGVEFSTSHQLGDVFEVLDVGRHIGLVVLLGVPPIVLAKPETLRFLRRPEGPS